MWIEKSFNTLEMLPEFFKNINDFKALTTIFNSELELFQDFVKQIMQNMFIETANDMQISKYCMLFGVDLNENKAQNLKTKLSLVPPYDVSSLTKLINRITGGECFISFNSSTSVKIIYTSADINIDEQLILKEIYNVLPCNIYVFLAYNFAKYEQLFDYIYSDFTGKTYTEILYNKF